MLSRQNQGREEGRTNRGSSLQGEGKGPGFVHLEEERSSKEKETCVNKTGKKSVMKTKYESWGGGQRGEKFFKREVKQEDN